MVRKFTHFGFLTLNSLVFVYSLCEAWDGFAEMQPIQNILSYLHSLDQSWGITETLVSIIEHASTFLAALLA